LVRDQKTRIGIVGYTTPFSSRGRTCPAACYPHRRKHQDERPGRVAFLTHPHQIVLVNALIEMLVPAALLATAGVAQGAQRA
jgi:hypothetical protein